jgi:hypothetical protein
MAHEWVILANLLGLLLGFALLSKHFEDRNVPAVLPRFLPTTGRAASAAGDGVRAVLVPRQHRRRADRRHDGRGGVPPARCTSAISPRSSRASNAGGSGSVVGDTTTTMMWIDGVDPLDVLEPTSPRGRARHLRHPPRASSSVLADREGRRRRIASTGARRHRRVHPRARSSRTCRQPAFPELLDRVPGHRRRGVGRDPR